MMPHFLHVCLDPTSKDPFLLISEQALDGTMPEIKAQVYFSHPATSLEDAEVNSITYPVSKKEIVNLLNQAQERSPVPERYTSLGLFSQGRVDKDAPFRIFNYPSKKQITELLAPLGIEELPAYE